MSKSVANACFAGESSAERFFPLNYRDSSDRRQALSNACSRRCKPEVIDLLRDQNRRFAASAERERQLERLAEAGAAAVLTGQQVGLFLGPLYSFYKAASAIALARHLEAESGHPVVPIFWLQTEDHDFPEICGCHLPGSDQTPTRLDVPADNPALSERRSIAGRQLGPGIEDALARLEAGIGSLPFGPTVHQSIARHYRSDQSWSDAFAALLAELFADEGLLIFDPRVPTIASLATDLHRRSIVDVAEVDRRLAQRSSELVDAGYSVQIQPRAGCSLSFYHPDGAAGGRFRIRAVNDGWALSGHPQTLDAEGLENALNRSPLSFSTSALLRPLLQDSLFPTAAYVGGPGEISYFAQLEPLYDWLGLPMPLIVPRGRFALLGRRVADALDEWGLAVDDLQRPDAELAERLQRGSDSNLSVERLQGELFAPFESTLQRLTPQLLDLDKTLQKSVDKTTEQVRAIVDRLAQRVQRAWIQADEQRVGRLDRARRWLFPNRAPQERIFSWPYFAARFGPDELKQAIFEAYEPFSAELREVRFR